MTDWRDHLGGMFVMDAGSDGAAQVRVTIAHKSSQQVAVTNVLTAAVTRLSWDDADARLSSI